MFQERYMRQIAAFVGVAAIIALLAYTYYAITQARYQSDMPVSFSVTGEAEVFAKPDVAVISFSVNAREDDQVTAQSKSAEAVNRIIAYLKENGVEEKDIRTEYYNLNPRYEYPRTVCNQWECPPAGDPKVVGYEVNQSLQVKVRKTEDAGKLIAGVGELGATNVSGPTFTIDDDSTLKAQAREMAIADAKAKAEKLAEQLDVRIVRITGFWEDEGPYPMYGYGKGGMMESVAQDAAIAPQMPTGENTISSRVNLSFEIE